MNKHKSNKIKENSDTVRHLIMGQIITTQNLVAIKEVRHAGQKQTCDYTVIFKLYYEHLICVVKLPISSETASLVLHTTYCPYCPYPSGLLLGHGGSPHAREASLKDMGSICLYQIIVMINARKSYYMQSSQVQLPIHVITSTAIEVRPQISNYIPQEYEHGYLFMSSHLNMLVKVAPGITTVYTQQLTHSAHLINITQKLQSKLLISILTMEFQWCWLRFIKQCNHS